MPREITIGSSNNEDASTPSYLIEVIASTMNTDGSFTNGVLRISLEMKSINLNPPKFVTPLTDITVKVNETEELTFPALIDNDGDGCQVISVSFGRASVFITGNYPNY